MHPADNVARLYLGLTQARLGDRQTGLKNIQAGMSGIANFLNYLESNFSYSFGQFWDPGGQIRASIKTDLAMSSSPNLDWSQLIAAGEKSRDKDRGRGRQSPAAATAATGYGVPSGRYL